MKPLNSVIPLDRIKEGVIVNELTTPDGKLPEWRQDDLEAINIKDLGNGKGKPNTVGELLSALQTPNSGVCYLEIIQEDGETIAQILREYYDRRIGDISIPKGFRHDLSQTLGSLGEGKIIDDRIKGEKTQTTLCEIDMTIEALMQRLSERCKGEFREITYLRIKAEGNRLKIEYQTRKKSMGGYIRRGHK